MEALRVEKASFTYQAKNGEIKAFDGIDIKAAKGEFISIVGPSGCGKSTLLSVIAGLLPKSHGNVYISGKLVQGFCAKMGYMLQRDNLLEWRNVYNNIMFGPELKGSIDEKTKSRAKRLLKTYGLWEFRNNYPRQLSGGMRQRVALIRTLVMEPGILLLDEAFSALDYQTRLHVTNDVHSILKKEGVTTLLVTHDIPESIALSDKILILSARPANVKEVLEINFDKKLSPLERRAHADFPHYFEHIWKELCENGN